MKKIFLALAAVAALASCVDENTLVPEQTADNLVTITAVSADTKTVLNGTDVVWEETDDIKVVLNMATDDELQDFAASAVDGATATFKGQFAGEVASASQAYAVYPSTAVTMNDNRASIYHTIYAEQHGEIKSGHNLSYASLDVAKLAAGNATATFSNVYSLIKVTVPEGLTEVTIASESPLAGTAPFKMEEGTLKVNTSAWSSLDQENTVRLVPTAGEQHLEAKTHDVLIFPGTHTLTITLSDGTTTYEKTVAANEYAAATYYNLNLTTVLSAPVTEYLASPFGGGTIEIPFVTTVDVPSYNVQIENGDGWLSYVDVKALTEGTVTLAVAAGENTTADRTATVTVTETTSEKSMVVSVTQKCVITDLLNEYLVSYKQYGQPYSGSLTIVRSDDYTKGVYKVTILGNNLYADYESGTLNIYEGKYTRPLIVTNDFKTISADNLSLGYSTYTEFKAILPLGPAVLTAEEEALVGTYNETWVHEKHAPATNAMEISASEEASFGQLKVKFLVTGDGSAYTGYASLEESVLKVQIGGQSHAKLGTQWNPDVVVNLTVNPDGTLTMPTWTDGNYYDLSEYLATPVIDSGDGDDEGESTGVANAASLHGTYSEEFIDFAGSHEGTMSISVEGENITVRMLAYGSGYSAYYLECPATLSLDGKTLTVESNGVTYQGSGMTFTENIILNINAQDDSITLSTDKSFALSAWGSTYYLNTYTATKQ